MKIGLYDVSCFTFFVTRFKFPIWLIWFYILTSTFMFLLTYWHRRPREIMVSRQSQSTQYLFSRHDHSSSRQHVDGACEDDYKDQSDY